MESEPVTPTSESFSERQDGGSESTHTLSKRDGERVEVGVRVRFRKIDHESVLARC